MRSRHCTSEPGCAGITRSRWALGTLVAGVLAALGAWSAPALAVVTRGVPQVGAGFSPITTDGGRYAVFQSVPDGYRVIDTVTGRSQDHPSPSGCAVSAIGAGLLVFECVGADHQGAPVTPAHAPVPLLVDMSTLRPLTEAPALGGLGTAPLPPGANLDRFVGVGKNWLKISVPGARASSTELVNWHSGQRSGAAPPAATSAQRAHYVLDLDQPSSPYQPVCASVARLRDHDRREFAYRPPWALLVSASDDRELTLARCGHAGGRVITRCPGICKAPVLSASYAAWLDGRGAAHTYRLRDGAKQSWLTPTKEGLDAIALTERALIASKTWLTGGPFFLDWFYNYAIRLAP